MGGVGSGPRKKIARKIQDAIADIDVDEILRNLKEWAKGTPVMCPHCKLDTGARTSDTVALQSAIELLNRRLGKPVQKQEMDINVNVAQIAYVYREALTLAEGEYKLLTEGDIIDGEEGLTNEKRQGS